MKIGYCELCGVEIDASRNLKSCLSCNRGYIKRKYKAMQVIHKAIKSGQLIRPKKCELCNDEPGFLDLWHRGTHVKRSLIVAHHYNGHNKPLDIWFICHKCNQKLKGPYYHSGQVTKDQARNIVNGADQ